MLRMELFSSVFIRALLLSIGYMSAMYLAYKIRPSKRSLVDGVLIFALMFLMSTRVEWMILKMASYVVLGYGLLVLNHKKNVYGSMLFTLVLVMMVSVSDLVSLNILTFSPKLLDAVRYQRDTIYGFFAVVIPSFVVMVNYILSGWIVGKTLDLENGRSKITYIMFSLFYLFLLMAISFILRHIVVYISPDLALEQVYRFIGFIYIPVVIIVAFSYYYLYHILKWEGLIKIREEELLEAEIKRRNGYRANHNLDNIVLTIHTLAKNQSYKELHRYLDKL